MTTIELELPDDLAQRARSEGLLSATAIEALLEGALRRHAGEKLLTLAKTLHLENVPPMSDEEVVAEVLAVRRHRAAAECARGGQ